MNCHKMYEDGLCTFQEYLRLDAQYNAGRETTYEDGYDEYREQVDLDQQEDYDIQEIIILDDLCYGDDYE